MAADSKKTTKKAEPVVVRSIAPVAGITPAGAGPGEAEAGNKVSAYIIGAGSEWNFTGSQTIDASAAENVSLAALAQFRCKSFLLLAMQSFTVLAMAIFFDLAVAFHSSEFVLAVCALALLSLAFVTYFRKKYPWNYIGNCVFSILAGACVGLSAEPLGTVQTAAWQLRFGPAIYGVGFYLVGVLLMSGLSLLRWSDLLPRMTPVAICVTIFVDVLMFSSFPERYATSHLAWCMVMVSCCILWVGMDLGRLSARLKPDEYTLPVILVWADLMTFVGLIALLTIGSVMEPGLCVVIFCDEKTSWRKWWRKGCSCDWWFLFDGVTIQPFEEGGKGADSDTEDEEEAVGQPVSGGKTSSTAAGKPQAAGSGLFTVPNVMAFYEEPDGRF